MFSQSNGLLECFSLGDKSDKDWGFISADVIAWTPLLKPRAQFVKFRKKIKTSRKITKNVQWVLAPNWLILNRLTDEISTKITYDLIQGRDNPRIVLGIPLIPSISIRVPVRVTANFSKSGRKILKFRTGHLVEFLHRMKPKKVLEFFTLTQDAIFVSQKPRPQIPWNIVIKLKILCTFRYTIWKVPQMTDKSFLTDKELIKLEFN